MKRMLALSLIVILLGTCTGCAESVSLTSEGSDLVAEYIAGEMLKYSVNNKWNYSKLNQATASSAQNPTNSVNSTPPTILSINGTTAAGNTLPSDSASGSGGGTTSNPVDEAGTLSALAASLGLTGITIQYSHYEIGDGYPKGDLAMAVPAETGKKLVAVEFMITNNTSSPINIDTTGKSVSMKLSINGGSSVQKSITILKNDITNMKDFSLTAGESYTTAALFQVSENNVADIKNMTLDILDGNKSIGKITIK